MNSQVPDGWITRTVGDIGPFFNGLSGKTSKDFGVGEPFLNYIQVFNQTLSDKDKLGFVKIEKGEKQQRVQYGDILFTTSSETPDEVGMTAVFLEKGLFPFLNSFCFGVRPNKRFPLLPEFANHFFRGDGFRENMRPLAQGSTRFNLSKNNLKKLQIIIPTVAEQCEIATILTSVDEVIEKTESQINKLQDLKKGMMQELLTKGIGHTEFKDSPVGRIPICWEVVTFDEIASSITCGIAATPRYVEANEGVPFLSAQNVVNGKVVLNSYRHIPVDLHVKLTRYTKPEKGDILYSRVGANYGEAGVVEFDWEFSIYVSLTLIKLTACCDKYFIKFLLNGALGKLQAKNGVFAGGGVPNLNVAIVKAFKIVLPPLDEQIAIANVLSSVDKKIETSSKKLVSLQLLKKAMMQDLLTGKIRVKVN